MYFYNIGYSTCEHCPDVVLLHERMFTEEELRGICTTALVDAWKATKPDVVPDGDGDPQESGDVSSSISFWFQNYFDEMVGELVKNHGFSHIKITAGFNPFGWGNMLMRNSWEEYASSNKDNIAIWDAFEKMNKK